MFDKELFCNIFSIYQIISINTVGESIIGTTKIPINFWCLVLIFPLLLSQTHPSKILISIFINEIPVLADFFTSHWRTKLITFMYQ